MTDLWAGAKSIGQAITQNEEGGECRVAVRYFLISRPAKVSEFAISVRSHWSVESIHWVLDVVFHDDACRIRTGNATASFTFTRRHVTPLLKRDTREAFCRMICGDVRSIRRMGHDDGLQ